jgi:hypothetical protein
MMAKKNAISAKAARLLRKVAQHILEEPNRYDQETFLKISHAGEEYLGPSELIDKFPACGTVGCIAGWVAALTAKNPKRLKDVQRFADKTLGITSDQSQRLFASVVDDDDIMGWPSKFSDAYRTAATQKQRAKVASRRIEHFIKTGE